MQPAHVRGGGTDTYQYDYENRLVRYAGLSSAAGVEYFNYAYDYRSRRIEVAPEGEPVRKVIFSGGTSVRELEGGTTTVEYVRGSDWGGGVGGVLYTLRGNAPSFSHYNGRGDVTAKTNGAGTITWQASYEAFGKRTQELGAMLDRQMANTKEEDPTGLLNEGMRYRDLETGTFLTRDPAGFVDGPNLYAYVHQNPWSKFDPEGLSERKSGQGVVPSEKVHHKVPFSSWDKHDLPKGVQEAFNGGESVIGTHSGGESHNFTGHGEYNRRVDGELQKYIKESGHPGGLSAKAQKEWADNFVKHLSGTEDKYIKGFNEVVGSGRTAVKRWSTTEGANIVKSEVSALRRLGRVGGQIADHGGSLLEVAGVLMTVSEFSSKAKAEGVGQAINDTAEELINPIGLNSREMKDVHRKAYSGFWDFLSPGSDDEENDRWNTLRD